MKDNNNLLGYNTWSAGEYSENTNGINTNCIIQTNKEYANIGENSIKIINNTETTKSAYTDNISCSTNKTYTLTCIIYNPDSRVNLVLMGSTGTYSVVGVTPSDSPKKVDVSYTTTNDTYILGRWNIYSDYCFIDNIKLIQS